MFHFQSSLTIVLWDMRRSEWGKNIPDNRTVNKMSMPGVTLLSLFIENKKLDKVEKDRIGNLWKSEFSVRGLHKS